DATVTGVQTCALPIYSKLPERLPIHWRLDGEVNRYGSRAEGAFLLPAMMIVVWLLLRFLPRIDPRRANYAKFSDTYDLLVNSLRSEERRVGKECSSLL